MPTNEEIWAEILLLRARFHERGNKITTWLAELDDMKRWRQEIDAWRNEVNRKIGEMVKADEIADAVAAKLEERRGLELTVMQKLGAAIVGLSVLAASVHSLFF